MWPSSLAILFLAFQSNYYELGIKALDQKRYEEAVQQFTNAIAAEPKDYTLFFNLGLAYSLWGKDADAVPEYKKALEMKPDLYQANLNLGISLLRLKNSAEAAPYLASAVAEKPQEYRPNYYLGAALLGAGDFAKSEQAYAAALAINPKSPDAELGLAHALAKQNRLAAAAPHFQKAADLNPSYREDLLELAALHEIAKQPSEAIAIYQQFPDNPGAQERLGALLLVAGRAAEAIPHLETAVAKSPTVANRAALATGYLKNNQPGQALPVVEQLLAADPNDFEIRMLRGRIIRDQRKFPEAAQDFERAVSMQPDSPEAWSELAGVLVMAENYPAALSALDKLAALHAEKPGHVYLRAIVLDRINDRKAALESYEKFLAMSNGQNPDEEFKARQRARILQREIKR
ncbi:MAG TPA: tetratricopeptide repeat protein [Bryobacteraceae bacterium]|nr:tetratricopeptide repeat protein [Bryobacteraceae bacterium]